MGSLFDQLVNASLNLNHSSPSQNTHHNSNNGPASSVSSSVPGAGQKTNSESKNAIPREIGGWNTDSVPMNISARWLKKKNGWSVEPFPKSESDEIEQAFKSKIGSIVVGDYAIAFDEMIARTSNQIITPIYRCDVSSLENMIAADESNSQAKPEKKDNQDENKQNIASYAIDWVKKKMSKLPVLSNNQQQSPSGPQSSAKWEWKDPQGNWMGLSGDAQQLLEDAYKNKKIIVEYSGGKNTYRVDLSKPTGKDEYLQVNAADPHRKRPVRRVTS